MNRRFFTTGLAVLAATFMLAQAPAEAGTTNYSAAKFQRLKASGKPFMLDFYATWCSTCRTQERVISKLKKSNPKLAGITVMKVDWDKYRGAPIRKSLGVPRRSTLIMFKGGREVGRVVAQTSESSIKRLMEKGV